MLAPGPLAGAGGDGGGELLALGPLAGAGGDGGGELLALGPLAGAGGDGEEPAVTSIVTFMPLLQWLPTPQMK